jgi:hypothetical protein
MNDFFPNDYTAPESSSPYTKFEQGENRVRILSKPLVGLLYWVDANGNPVAKGAKPQSGNKPVRKPYKSIIPMGADVKEFQAFVVWNYTSQKIEIMELTQKGLMKTITNYARDEKWGDPRQYDFKISRKGSALDTEYTMMVDPKEPVDPGIQQLFLDMNVNLEELFLGGDPFNSNAVRTDEPKPVTPVKDVDIDDVLGA